MATNLTVKNTSQTNTVRIRLQNKPHKLKGWKDAEVDALVPPGKVLDIWLSTDNRRVIIEELPT